jgi:hypothetical protein
LAVARRGYDNLLAARLFGNWWHVVFAEACIDALAAFAATEVARSL